MTIAQPLAIVPCRLGSKGVPLKNIRPLNGISPVVRAVSVAKAAGCRVVVTSDASVREQLEWGCNADGYHMRPAELATDDAPMIGVIQDVLASCPDGDLILLVQCTQPLRQPKHLRAAIEALTPAYSSVVSVVEIPKAESPELLCWIGDLSGYLCPFDVKRGLLGGEPRDWSMRPTTRQATVPWYRPDGTVYASRRAAILNFNSLFGPCCRPLIIQPDETCSLDTPEDWLNAERRLKGKSWTS